MKTYTTEELKEIIKHSDDSYFLLMEHCPLVKKKFKRLTEQLDELLKEVQKVFPDANYYTGSGGFNLLIGNSHNDDRQVSSNQEMVALSAEGLSVGDGDW